MLLLGLIPALFLTILSSGGNISNTNANTNTNITQLGNGSNVTNGSNLMNGEFMESDGVKVSYMLSAEGFGGEQYFNNSFRFSSAYDKNFWVFQIENNYTQHELDELGGQGGLSREQPYLNACFHECNQNPYCNGVFYRIRTNLNVCTGLSYLGKIAQTRVRSLSYTKTRSGYPSS